MDLKKDLEKFSFLKELKLINGKVELHNVPGLDNGSYTRATNLDPEKKFSSDDRFGPCYAVCK